MLLRVFGEVFEKYSYYLYVCDFYRKNVKFGFFLGYGILQYEQCFDKGIKEDIINMWGFISCDYVFYFFL